MAERLGDGEACLIVTQDVDGNPCRPHLAVVIDWLPKVLARAVIYGRLGQTSLPSLPFGNGIVAVRTPRVAAQQAALGALAAVANLALKWLRWS